MSEPDIRVNHTVKVVVERPTGDLPAHRHADRLDGASIDDALMTIGGWIAWREAVYSTIERANGEVQGNYSNWKRLTAYVTIRGGIIRVEIVLVPPRQEELTGEAT